MTPLSVLRTRPLFARLWLGALVSGLGDNLSWLALTWFVLERTERGAAVGALLLCFALPAVVTGPLWGRALDRWQPGPLMLLDTLARAVLIGLIPLLDTLDILQWWMVLVIAALMGALAPATGVGVCLLIPALLADEELEPGNAAYGLTGQIPTVFGPALAGLLVAAWGAPRALLVDALTFLFMAGVLLGLPRLPRGHHTASRPQANIRQGWSPVVWAVLGLTTLFSFVYGPLEAALPVLARESLGTGAQGYGALWSALGVGMVVGTFLVGTLGRAFPVSLVLVGIMALWGLVVMGLPLACGVGPALAVMFAGGVIWGPYTALETTLLQRSVPTGRHGRLFGLRAMLLGPAAPLGTALGGLLLLGLSAGWVIALSGLGCLLGAFLALPWLRRGELGAGAEPVG
ncbi:MFS transporter [Deinococcus apachensis]|uniref:MFS transporter n=1 Tax=Deinococcus apachensis TaxID=309886 RepID=UPI00036CA522|nr:MFS transporter [Deinococcus apachensis]